MKANKEVLNKLATRLEIRREVLTLRNPNADMSDLERLQDLVEKSKKLSTKLDAADLKELNQHLTTIYDEVSTHLNLSKSMKKLSGTLLQIEALDSEALLLSPEAAANAMKTLKETTAAPPLAPPKKPAPQPPARAAAMKTNAAPHNEDISNKENPPTRPRADALTKLRGNLSQGAEPKADAGIKGSAKAGESPAGSPQEGPQAGAQWQRPESPRAGANRPAMILAHDRKALTDLYSRLTEIETKAEKNEKFKGEIQKIRQFINVEAKKDPNLIENVQKILNVLEKELSKSVNAEASPAKVSPRGSAGG